MTALPIAFENVSVRFGEIRALDSLNLGVQAGQIVALTGLNGAGKSTALRVAIGQIAPTGGAVAILSLSPKDARSQFGYLPDKDNHFEEFSARRNLNLFAALYNVPRSRIETALKLVGLIEAADRRVATFSLGMRRRLLLARTLLHEPKVLLLDEPLANLDSEGQAMVIGALRESRAAGGAVLFTAHRLDRDEFVDRQVIIDRGRVVSDSPLQGGVS